MQALIQQAQQSELLQSIQASEPAESDDYPVGTPLQTELPAVTPTPSPTSTPRSTYDPEQGGGQLTVDDFTCVEVGQGNGWSQVTKNIGLPWALYEKLMEEAQFAAGFLIENGVDTTSFSALEQGLDPEEKICYHAHWYQAMQNIGEP